MDDLLDGDIGKHDYDWLLTPPGTPRQPKVERIEKKPVPIIPVTTNPTVPKRTPVRSSSTTRASRLSSSTTTQPHENGHNAPSTRPVRSSSVTRSSYIAPSSTNIRTNNTPLNTSSMSLSSSRPSTPTKRVSSLTSNRPTVPVVSSRTSRSSTPVKSRPSPPSVTKPTPTRSSTPTRPRTATSTSTVPSRPLSRSSTPTRTGTGMTSSSPVIRSPSVGRTRTSAPTLTTLKRVPSTSGLNSAPTSRPSSPGQRSKAPVRPLDIPDFPNETPPNLRTKLPERPASSGRTRPGLSLTQRTSSQPEPVPVVPANKKSSVPVVSRSKFSDMPSSRVSPGLSNGHPNKPAPVQKQAGTGSDGFGRTISKKSLDMAIRHMDIKQNLGGIKGASLFPHSIRSKSNKPGQQKGTRASDPPAHSRSTSNDRLSEGSLNGTSSDKSRSSPDRNIMLLKDSLNDFDLYGSSRYDTILSKEDAKNTNWLHGVDDDDDKGFDLPEPF